jgi:hypothetical protein
MATKANLNPTMMDIAKGKDPDGKTASVVELLNDTNEVLQDVTFVACNDGTTHLTTLRAALPEVHFRKLYKGVKPSKSSKAQVRDVCGMIEARSVIDAKLDDINGNDKAWRLSEEMSFFEAMGQTFCQTLFYGDTDVNPDQFHGLSVRFNEHQDTDNKEPSFNVINGAGAGDDNTSIWFMVWGQTTAHCIYPKGTEAGIKMEDLGKQEVDDGTGSGSLFTALMTKWQWDPGFSLRDWRSVVRIANLDVSLLKANSGAADLFDLMTIAWNKQKGRKMGRAVIYCNNTVKTALDRQAQKKENLFLTYKDVSGEPILHYRGIPIRECEAILDAEAVVPAVS